MTEKRFRMCYEQNDINGWTMSIVDWETKEPFDYTTYEVHSSSMTDTRDEMEDLCLLLNELSDENEQLRKENDMFSCELSVSANKEISRNCRITELEEENEQLKQRNNRQYEQLSRLYNLIEQKEWRVLTDIIDNLKKYDEQLQKEWRTYGDM